MLARLHRHDMTGARAFWRVCVRHWLQVLLTQLWRPASSQ
jgi:hypothetical protein